MASTRTSGITIDADGHRLIDKRHRGIRIGMRVGAMSQEQAERLSCEEMKRLDDEISRRSYHRPNFADCALRYLEQSRDMRSLESIRVHVRRWSSISVIWSRCRSTTARWGHSSRQGSPTARARPRSLEVLRTILRRAARSYRDDSGRPWLDAIPPLITMLPEHARPPYPITWDGQDRLFPKLPGHLARMALFAVNTDLRDSNVCGLESNWEVRVPEIGRSVFVVPEEARKSKRPHVVILNDIAWSIVQTQRGRHPIWVFPYQGRSIGKMNNSAWQRARLEVGLRGVRVHDLRHTFACRLRAAGVSAEDRAALRGHANQSMVGPHASADVGRLLVEANLVLNRQETRTRIARCQRLKWKDRCGQTVPQRSHGYANDLVRQS